MKMSHQGWTVPLYPVSRGLEFDAFRMFGKHRAAVVKGR